MWLLVILLGILLGISVFVNINILKKLENSEIQYESDIVVANTTLSELYARIKFIRDQLKQLDDRGSFEADDEIGFFFTEVKKLETLLEEFLPENDG